MLPSASVPSTPHHPICRFRLGVAFGLWLTAPFVWFCSTPASETSSETSSETNSETNSELVDETPSNLAEGASIFETPGPSTQSNTQTRLHEVHAPPLDYASAPSVSQPLRHGVPDDAKQAIVVSTASWNSYRGQLQRFERTDASGWGPVDAGTFPVTLGKRGLAWGRGLHPDLPSRRVKKEGDHRSPAGVFDIGEARGYATESPPGTAWPFEHSGKRFRCMDNPRSPDYNSFISTAGIPLPPPGGLASREKVFEFMLFVMHNTSPVQRGAGSCVFLHVWARPEVPTQGCVAMSRDVLAETLAWLKPEHRPVLIQLPEPAYIAFADDWSLPHLAHFPARDADE